MLWPKINSYKEFDNERKIPAARKFPPPHPPPPITFAMVRPKRRLSVKISQKPEVSGTQGTLLPQSGHRKLETRKPLDKTSLIHKMAAEASSVVTSKAPGTPCFRASYPKEKFSALCIFRIQR